MATDYRFLVTLTLSDPRSPARLARAIKRAVLHACDVDIEGAEALEASTLGCRVRVVHADVETATISTAVSR